MDKQKKHKRKGLIATIIYHVLLLLMFIFAGLTYEDPPPEDGIAINFGYEEDGSGNTSQSTPEQTQPEPQQEVVEETAEEVIDEVATQEVVDAPNVTEEKTEPKKEEPKEEVEEKPQPDNNLVNALNKTKNSEEAGQGEGEGETEGGADQGDRNGDPNSPNRNGNGGIGNSGNYRLGNRKALSKPKPIYDCEAQGRVVVKVKVDRNGRTISAETGVNIPNGPKTNATAPCLMQRAKQAAMKTTWQGDPTATEWQTGYIIYNFTKR